MDVTYSIHQVVHYLYQLAYLLEINFMVIGVNKEVKEEMVVVVGTPMVSNLVHQMVY